MEYDVEGLPRVGGTEAGGYYEIATDVIVGYPRDGYMQTEEGARASLLEQHRIARDRRRRVVTIILLDRVKSQDSTARRIWKTDVDTALVCGLALVGSSLLGRAIGSFFIGLTRPRVPTVMVGTLAEAVAWGEVQIAERGGSIDD